MRYIPSMWIGQLSGRQGSTVATHTRYSSFFRNRIMPINPRTAAQTLVRDAMTSFAQNWKALTADERDAWAQLAQLVPGRNTQGVSIILSPSTFYVKFNLDRRTVGLARLDTAPPAVEVPPSMTALSATNSQIGPVMAVDPTVIDGTANNFLVVYATQPIGTGQAFLAKHDYRLLAAFAGNIATPIAIVSAYNAVFGIGWQTFTGMDIGYRVLGVSDAGFQGEAVTTRTAIL